MRTTIDIPDEYFDDLKKYTKGKTKTQAVNEALKEYVRIKRIKAFMAMRGKMKTDFDVRKFRDLDRHE